MAGFYQFLLQSMQTEKSCFFTTFLKGTTDEYIVTPGLGKRSAILGTMAIARNLTK
jgi:hypothetical protein